MPGGHYMRPRVYINGVELEDVEDVEVNVERVETTTFSDPEPVYIPGETRVEISTRPQWPDPVEIVTRAFDVPSSLMTAPEYRRDTHEFVQDENELPVKLCLTCGMWPEHHNHAGYPRRGGCVCSDCLPDAEQLPEGDPVPNSSESTVRFGGLTTAGRRADRVIIDEAVNIPREDPDDLVERARAIDEPIVFADNELNHQVARVSVRAGVPHIRVGSTSYYRPNNDPGEFYD